MHRALLAWFDANKRSLPWRDDRDPYRIWISEVMLQQTQATTAIPYYRRWLERFPTLTAVARADLDEVLKVWEGLGYYNRAVRLHRTAMLVQAHFGGQLPNDPAELGALPGIGHYTCAAIASIAFGVPVVAVDANVARVASRLFARNDLGRGEAAVRLEKYQPPDRPGDFTEALMELGATVCTPRNPTCEICPLRPSCLAYAEGRVTEFPAAAERKKKPHRHRYALVHIEHDGVALRRRGSDEMLPGLWGFVQSDTEPEAARLLDPVRHSYTHFDLTLVPALVSTRPSGTVPISIAELTDIAASRVDRKVLAQLRHDGDPSTGYAESMEENTR